MPYGIFNSGGLFCVHKLQPNGAKGQKMACHETRDDANKQLAALHAAEPNMTGGEARSGSSMMNG